MRAVIHDIEYDFFWQHHNNHNVSAKCSSCGMKKRKHKSFTKCFVVNLDSGIAISAGPDNRQIVGEAHCHPVDQYVKSVGRRVSFNDAAIKLVDKIALEAGMSGRIDYKEKLLLVLEYAYLNRGNTVKRKDENQNARS